MITIEEFMQIFDKLLIEVGDHFDIYYEKDNNNLSSELVIVEEEEKNYQTLYNENNNVFKEKL
jgi:hypothetical protein